MRHEEQGGDSLASSDRDDHPKTEPMFAADLHTALGPALLLHSKGAESCGISPTGTGSMR